MPSPSSSSSPQPPRATEALTSDALTSDERAAVFRMAGRGHEVGDARDLRPIGKARLKALREAIRSGTYPSRESVEGGLFRMFTRPASRRPRG